MLRTSSPGHSISMTPRKLLRGGRRRSQAIYKFATKREGSLNIRIRGWVFAPHFPTGVLCSLLSSFPSSLVEVKLHGIRKAFSNTYCLRLTSMYFGSLCLSLLICNNVIQTPINCFCSLSSLCVFCFKVDYNLPIRDYMPPIFSPQSLVQSFHKTVI